MIDAEEFYFTYITSYAKWNNPLEGFKKRWKQEVVNFRQAHTESVQTYLFPSSPLYILALTSLTESVAWVTGFTNYIDEIFTQYNGGKFGIKKSRHVITKLAMALVRDVVQQLFSSRKCRIN